MFEHYLIVVYTMILFNFTKTKSMEGKLFPLV